MKMIPNVMEDRDNPRKGGERIVFDILERLNMDGVVLHSLLQKNQKYKMIGEVDFLMICKYGVFCIEVKGGTIVRKNGKWASINKNGIENPIKDPFAQAKDCRYAAHDYVKGAYRDFYRNVPCLFGYCIVFPECRFKDTGNDLVTEVLFDAGKKEKGSEFGDFIKAVYEHWKSEEETKHGFTPKLLNNNEIDRLASIYRRDIQAVPSLILSLQNIEQQMVDLTEEQCSVLDACEENDQIIITGAAGTGKSILAIEQLRRKITDGVKVAYVCFNRNMAQYAKDSIKTIPPECFVGTYHSLLMPKGGDAETRMSVTDIAKNIIELNEMFDYLIIDEAQDLFYTEVLDSFKNILKGGLTDGKWIIFMDRKQNIFNKTEDFDFVEKYILETCKPARHTLTINCRNTLQIARRNAFLTQTEHAKCLKVHGEIVAVKTYKTDTDFLPMIKYELQSLLTGGVSIRDIVILSRHVLDKSLLKGVETLCNYKLNTPSDISYFNKNCINYFTIHSFKGLESKIVFLIDVDGFKSDQNRVLNYVGMSRAKALLYMFLPERIMDEYMDLTC
jgi:hypothetical protein